MTTRSAANAVHLLASLAGDGAENPSLGCILIGDKIVRAGNGRTYAEVPCNAARKVALLVPAAVSCAIFCRT